MKDIYGIPCIIIFIKKDRLLDLVIKRLKMKIFLNKFYANEFFN